MGLNRMMMKKNGQSKQLYHLKSSYVQIGENIIVLGFCAEETQNDLFGTIPPMGSLTPNEYCGTKIKNILMLIDLNQSVGGFGVVEFYGKLPENATGERGALNFRIPQLGNLQWASTFSYNESTNITSSTSDVDIFPVDNLGSLENLYLTIAPYVRSDSK